MFHYTFNYIEAMSRIKFVAAFAFHLKLHRLAFVDQTPLFDWLLTTTLQLPSDTFKIFTAWAGITSRSIISNNSWIKDESFFFQNIEAELNFLFHLDRSWL